MDVRGNAAGKRWEFRMKNRLLDLGLLWLRVFVGLGLMYHGWLKVQSGAEAFAENAVAPLGFPLPLLFAWLSIAAELIGGFFLVLGLWTRIAALVLCFNMGVAAFGRNAGNPVIAIGKGPTMELSLAYLLMVSTVLMLGAGAFSIDAGRKGGGRSPAARKPKR